ncbi:isoleucyl-tRNA synthetase [Streptococcus agalactiae LMG 14747]|uniref:Isoleucyl-tRNA synthetase n=1 Tax=Streptococcus agalactiae LMG 14747 TaxID=1154860 RepID=V6Z038_STRAG|nr:isoleucyl-tRNA synthetase [Streptococcus agalactiae LMG 14747]
MKPQELFDQVKEMIAKKDFSEAKTFIEDHKDDLGQYFDKAKALVENSDTVSGVVDKVKSLFNK